MQVEDGGCMSIGFVFYFLSTSWVGRVLSLVSSGHGWGFVSSLAVGCVRMRCAIVSATYCYSSKYCVVYSWVVVCVWLCACRKKGQGLGRLPLPTQFPPPRQLLQLPWQSRQPPLTSKFSTSCWQLLLLSLDL